MSRPSRVLTTDEQRWWKLYREERATIAPGKAGWKRTLTAQQITHVAREATRRFREEAAA